MKKNTRLGGLLLTACALTITAAPTFGAVPDVAPAHERCSALTPTTLPQTADAAEAWLMSCDRDEGLKVPSSADGAAAWLER
jgi:hypothetical protein